MFSGFSGVFGFAPLDFYGDILVVPSYYDVVYFASELMAVAGELDVFEDFLGFEFGDDWC